ncbi:hypothetical protein CLAFUW4_11867 [Fulvia fulva]|uniref:F-box domain-containing protein n=1 Tax=Passalora fulva TaxID=5499 RepID=A0A9Q8USX6_PASFU|nr:uncharacterized protein CLAFUR5_10909 [Fulvia fulva]KAK4617575.1 hypothetical protein CLAFUR4_11872 [Fulvia fulva]KAK4618851.1 hypothetical protein CLAFUR0_11885 [Fulvia fulva]UJO21251.1 hypothetical protein CLAFUR5_10909 [Fulvia fulva]WPV18658.1 hypothetical protein CLAFUW4_11867 [Fulvia fulva]WPV33628.1 hypothetical protein CLAFUW7_11874 [Fulvia fulva]
MPSHRKDKLQFVEVTPDGQVTFSAVRRKVSLDAGLESKAMQASPLLSLPPEILNDILNYTLVDYYAIRLCASETSIRYIDKHTGRPCYKTSVNSFAKFAEPPLLSTSKWLRKTGLPMFYGANIFNLASFKDTEYFLTSIGLRKSRMIRHLFGSDGQKHHMWRRSVARYAEKCRIRFKLFLRPGVLRFAVKHKAYPDKLFWLDFRSCTALVTNRKGNDLRMLPETACFKVKKKRTRKKRTRQRVVPTAIKMKS